MKFLALVCNLLLISVLPAYCGEKTAKTMAEWVAVISKDSKLDSLQSTIGKPDDISIKSYTYDGVLIPCIYQTWYSKLNSGKASPDSLCVVAFLYQNQNIIVGISDPLTDNFRYFSWAKSICEAYKLAN
jgi:hypothetical protein